MSQGEGKSLRFGPWPSRTLLESGELPVADLARLALRESHRTSPIFRVHRWFARRLRSQFRSILAALILPDSAAESFWDTYFGRIRLDNALVVDPFVGGGTSLVEASRCGAKLIGFDIDPVAVGITRFELGTAEYAESLAAAAQVQDAVEPQVSPYHVTRGEDGEERQVLHHFWVQVVTCAECGSEVEVHPHFRLAWTRDSQWVFCRICHAVAAVEADATELRCSCGVVTQVLSGTQTRNVVTCPLCGNQQPLAPAEAPPQWRLFAQEYLEPGRRGLSRRFRTATPADRELFDAAAARFASIADPVLPTRPIPVVGRSDRRPVIHGIRHYTDLFNARQRLHLSLLAHELRSLSGSERRLVGLAFSEHLATNCMYAGYAFGYRRLAPLFSIHAFRHIVRPVELNPWAPVGRGTFPNAVAKLRDAIGFAASPTDLDPTGGMRPSSWAIGTAPGPIATVPSEVTGGRARAAVVAGSATRMREMPTASVDLVLTDPPYYDNVGYSELSDFYLAWQQAVGVAEPPYDDPAMPAPLEENLALSSRNGEAVCAYRAKLSQIFCECHRVVRADGLMVFTYHHRSPTAWLAVASALRVAGWRCTGIMPLRAEGRGGLHTFAGTIKWDAVMVCRKGSGGSAPSSDSLVVSDGTLETALHAVDQWSARLSAAEIGFALPDAVNLLRAYLAVRATACCSEEDGKTLEWALQAAPSIVADRSARDAPGAPSI